jgi:hypothetical protein
MVSWSGLYSRRRKSMEFPVDNLADCVDASKWASEYIRVVKNGHEYLGDRQILISWFGLAIMEGYLLAKRLEKEVIIGGQR